MANDSKDSPQSAPLSEAQIRARSVGEPEQVSDKIRIVDCDPHWPEIFRRESDRIKGALGSRALRIEHTGSTSVPGLAAKPVVDMLLVVADSADEDSYVPDLEGIGYVLRIREPGWHQHRMFKGNGPETNLHVFSSGCPEISHILLFRDWLRSNAADRDLYARTKAELSEKEWKYFQNYADAKSTVIEEILERARLAKK